jgi:hypothetical protein
MGRKTHTRSAVLGWAALTAPELALGPTSAADSEHAAASRTSAFDVLDLGDPIVDLGPTNRSKPPKTLRAILRRLGLDLQQHRSR